MNWKTALKGYLNPSVLVFLFLGFSCGIPHSLIGYSLTAWLTDCNIGLSVIGFFALVMLPYNFKFLWAPFIDRFRLPFMPPHFGHLKGWLVLFQLGLFVCVTALALSAPDSNTWLLSVHRGDSVVNIPMQTYILAFAVAFFAASQDIVVDALRINILKKEEFGEGAGAYQFGYRMGGLLAGAGIVAASAFISWQSAYLGSTVLLLIGLGAALWVKESGDSRAVSTTQNFWQTTIIAPFADFMKRPNWLWILLFIVLFKLCNAVLGRMAMPFYLAMEFSKSEIALISGTIGPWVTISGIAIGGVLVMRYPILKLLLVLGSVEILTSVVFACFSLVGHSIPFFLVVILFDNIVGGMGGATFVAFLSGLCTKRFAATQYALLTSLMMVALSVISLFSGIWAEMMGWFNFFMFTGVLMIPALVLLCFLIKAEKNQPATK